MPDNSIVFATLPEIDTLNPKDRAVCVDLLEELESTTIMIDSMEARADEIKLLLEAIQYKMDTPGLRYGALAYCCKTAKGRTSLDRTMLIEAGVPKHVLDQCTKIGVPTIRRTFKRIPEYALAGGPGEPPADKARSH